MQHTQDGDPAASNSSSQTISRRHFTAGSRVSRSALGKLRVAELREELQQEGLSTHGLKAELVERLYSLLLEGERLAVLWLHLVATCSHVACPV